MNADQIGRIDALFKRARRYRLTDDTYDFVGLLDCVENRLFKSLQNETHSLHHLLPPIKSDAVSLRSRGHRYMSSLDANWNSTVNLTFLDV